MQHETDLIARQQRRQRIQRVLLALPWICFVLAMVLSLWALPN